eukprot:3136574-Amphidinium_carterae.1
MFFKRMVHKVLELGPAGAAAASATCRKRHYHEAGSMGAGRLARLSHSIYRVDSGADEFVIMVCSANRAVRHGVPLSKKQTQPTMQKQILIQDSSSRKSNFILALPVTLEC